LKILCIDAGNSFIKIAVAEEDKITVVDVVPLTDMDGLRQRIASLPQVEACIVSSVGFTDRELIQQLAGRSPFFMELTADTPVPINNLYATPETLGKDRLAAVVGAHSLYPDNNVLVIDAGTAMTIDFVDRLGNYHGGNISPGLQMRYQALHDYTKKLPLQNKTFDYQTIGNSTESAIVAGVQNGMIFEVENYISYFSGQYSDMITIMTGGDTFFLVNKIEKPIFVESNLIFIGLRKIVAYNIKLKQ
jgi:type III pantothenate kinase